MAKYKETNNEINKILKNNKLTKEEKIKKMFIIFRKYNPDESKEEIFEWCQKYYQYKIGKIHPDKFYF
jgi:hypothetical protein